MLDRTVRVAVVPVENLSRAIAVLAKYTHNVLKPAFSERKVYIPLKELPTRQVMDFVVRELNAEFVWMLPDVFPRRARVVSLKRLEKETGVATPKSVTIVGDILLVNKLPECTEGREFEIGRILLKNFGVRAVFLKVEKFGGIERVASWHRIAGWGDTFTVHRENHCWFSLDISKVFFNPRLGNERLRIARSVKKDEVVVDMFAGVGPFAILIKKLSNSQVYAIDINKHAVEFIRLNSRLNKVDITILEGDARVRVLEIEPQATRIIMNYPERSVDFIDAATSALSPGGMIHLYIFSRADGLENVMTEIRSIIERCGRRIMGLSSRIVEEVSPRKYIYCIDMQVL